MSIGKEKYGHGLKVEMDTRQWGTRYNSWLEMAEEEYMDAIVYVVADYIKKTKEVKNDKEENIESEDDNTMILKLINTTADIESDFHRSTIESLKSLVQTNLTKYHPH